MHGPDKETRSAPAGTDPLSAPRADTVALTPRELQILRLMAEGLSNKEIAACAHVSLNTVKTHLSRGFDKLGVRSREDAARIARERGLLR